MNFIKQNVTNKTSLTCRSFQMESFISYRFIRIQKLLCWIQVSTPKLIIPFFHKDTQRTKSLYPKMAAAGKRLTTSMHIYWTLNELITTNIQNALLQGSNTTATVSYIHFVSTNWKCKNIPPPENNLNTKVCANTKFTISLIINWFSAWLFKNTNAATICPADHFYK